MNTPTSLEYQVFQTNIIIRRAYLWDNNMKLLIMIGTQKDNH